MKWILLTGATGFVGRHVLQALLNDGHSVAVLLRNKEGQVGTAASRWFDVLSRVPANQLKQVTPIYGSLFELDGVKLFTKTELVLAVVHCAADVSFGKDADPKRTNVDGLRSLLELMEELGIPELHHVSTAYVCGNNSGTANECQLSVGQAHKNPYERSKFMGELMVHKFRNKDIPKKNNITIYRPTIVVGDSVTGRTSCFNGFYHLIKIVAKVAKLKKSLDVGAGRILKVRIALDGNEPLNLVPVDYVARFLARCVKYSTLQNKTYHVTPSRPLRVSFILQELQRYFGEDNLPEIEFVGKNYWANRGGIVEPANPIEEDLPKWLGVYKAYFGTDPYFDTTNADWAMQGPYLPEQREWLHAIIDYAVKSNFGRRAI